MTAVLIAGLGLGCRDQSIRQSKSQAYQRWYHTRAQMLYGVGLEHWKVGQLDRARNKALEALALESDHVEARILLGKVYIEKGHYPAAVRELARACQLRPRSAEAMFLLAVALEKDTRYAEALQRYQRAYALDPKNVSAIQGAAEVMVLMGRVEQAQDFVEGYLADAPEHPGLFETAGRLAIMRRQYDRAARHFRQACDLNYENVAYVEAMGRAQFLAGQYEPAAETLKGLTERKAYTAPVWVYTMLGDCYMALDRPFKARDAYYVATERKPEDAGVWLNLAKAAMKLGDTARAILSAHQALSCEPRCLEATMVLGYALIRANRASEAVAVLSAAADKHPKDGMVQCLLGRAYAAVGNRAEAQRRYELASRLDPSNRVARELLAESRSARRPS